MSESILEKRIKLLEEKLALYHRALYTAIIDLEARIPLDLLEKIDLNMDYSLSEGSWFEKSKKLQPIMKSVLRYTIELILKKKGPVTHREIYQYVCKRTDICLRLNDNGHETIPRLVRFLVEQGYLTRIKKGLFFLGPKVKSFEKARVSVWV